MKISMVTLRWVSLIFLFQEPYSISLTSLRTTSLETSKSRA
jgi:hypothetical protein